MSYNRLIQIDGKLVDRSQQNRIKEVAAGSPAHVAGIVPGETLLRIDGRDLKDIIDYRFLSAEKKVVLTIMGEDGQTRDVTIEKDTYEDLGLTFMSGLIDKANSCSNSCIFCFIDQLPEGMRESLYFKDDDSRLSFLQGNFVTLTNMTESDIDRILEYRISPINVSVHTTNGELRNRILGNRNAYKVLERMKRLADGRIHMNAQIVLMPGINDGEELKKTIEDLKSLHPYVGHVAVVPLGLTKHRENLPVLTPFDRDSAARAIEDVERMNQDLMEELGTNFVRCADEFYVLAGIDVPSEDYYEGYDQIEDGIGMIRLFRESTEMTLEDLKEGPGEFTLVTGTSAYGEIGDFVRKVRDVNPEIDMELHCVKNDFFGESITVAGLLTGKDIIKALKGARVRRNLIMPRNMFRAGEDVMLDDVTVADIERELSTKVLIVDYTGEDIIEKINGRL